MAGQLLNHKILVVLAAGLAAAAVYCLWPARVNRAHGPLPNDVYVWQRAWAESVETTVAERGTNFGQIVTLAAEVSWKQGQPQCVRVALEPTVLRKTERRIGLALRIGSYPGPFKPDDPKGIFLTDLAASLVTEAKTNRLSLAELQIDFDCAESKLDGYATWVKTIRTKVAPVPVVITALPAWLKRPAFKRLIAVADGYILQVHSLEKPKTITSSFHLCDPKAARQAVERAAKLGKPFRVALPTYGYTIAFASDGPFIGLSAEGPAMSWPEGTQVRELRADPQAIAQLVQGWNTDRPQALTGLIWYRLPIPGDRLNWRWPTLASVMAGNIPKADLRADARHPAPALVEIDLINAGTADYTLPVQVTLSWQDRDSRLIAADGLQGFDATDIRPGAILFQHRPPLFRLPVGERRHIGWVRFHQQTRVQVEISNSFTNHVR